MSGWAEVEGFETLLVIHPTGSHEWLAFDVLESTKLIVERRADGAVRISRVQEGDDSPKEKP